jgi:hypothetical protein
MTFATMFRDKISPKAFVTAFAFYLVAATVAFAIVVRLWMPAGVSPERMAQLAETDPTLALWQRILGVSLATLAGYLACRLGGRTGLRNSLVVGCLLVLYGVVSIFLHPNDPMTLQVGKLLTPVPIVLLGGWLCLRFAPRKNGDDAQSQR